MAAYCAARSSCGTGSSREVVCGCALIACSLANRASCNLPSIRHRSGTSPNRLYNDAPKKMFAKRTNWNLETNRLSAALAAHRAAGKPLIDLTVSNPTECGFQYDEEVILSALRNPLAMRYEPNPRGLEPA